jgi:hypothetical protein
VTLQFDRPLPRAGDASFDPSHTDELVIGLRRELYARSFAGIVYTYKHSSTPWEYQGVDFSVSARPNDALDLYVAYTLSWLTQYNAVAFDDHRHAVKLRVSYAWRGLSAGVLFQYYAGTPDLFEFNARLAYDLHALTKQHLFVIADFFDLLDRHEAPFRFQIGVRYAY